MALSPEEQEKLRQKAWENRAKGRGVRWRMIRDTMSVVSVYWMTLSEVETCMVRIWGLTRRKTREILEEMVQIGDVTVEKDEKTGDLKYKLNQDRVNFWMGRAGVQGIPAGIVQVVETTRSARSLEEARRIPGGGATG
jgi:hypothetical protein